MIVDVNGKPYSQSPMMGAAARLAEEMDKQFALFVRNSPCPLYDYNGEIIPISAIPIGATIYPKLPWRFRKVQQPVAE